MNDSLDPAKEEVNVVEGRIVGSNDPPPLDENGWPLWLPGTAV